jgi:hypothetical protein
MVTAAGQEGKMIFWRGREFDVALGIFSQSALADKGMG